MQYKILEERNVLIEYLASSDGKKKTFWQPGFARSWTTVGEKDKHKTDCDGNYAKSVKEEISP